jgi:hypothetical protein
LAVGAAPPAGAALIVNLPRGYEASTSDQIRSHFSGEEG